MKACTQMVLGASSSVGKSLLVTALCHRSALSSPNPETQRFAQALARLPEAVETALDMKLLEGI